MGIISGQDSHCQIGLESTWGTGVTPTLELSFTSESLKYVPNYISEDALVGRKTTSRMDVSGKKGEGDISFLCKPDEIGLLLAAALGAEGDYSQIDSSAAYSHQFSPVAGGTSGSLPHLTVVVDRKVAVAQYTSYKIGQLTLEAAVNDYLRGTISGVAYDEEAGSLESLTPSSLRAFQFVDGEVKVDDTAWTSQVTDINLTYNNNLEDELYTMGTDGYMAEIEPQKREITAEIEVLYDSTTNTVRTNDFKAGTTIDLWLKFESTEEADTDIPYQLIIEMPLCYITDASPNVGGPERIRQTLSVSASENASNEAITVTLVDAQGSDYLS